MWVKVEVQFAFLVPSFEQVRRTWSCVSQHMSTHGQAELLCFHVYCTVRACPWSSVIGHFLYHLLKDTHAQAAEGADQWCTIPIPESESIPEWFHFMLEWESRKSKQSGIGTGIGISDFSPGIGIGIKGLLSEHISIVQSKFSLPLTTLATGIRTGIGIKDFGLESESEWNQTFELTWNRNRNHTWVGIVHHWSGSLDPRHATIFLVTMTTILDDTLRLCILKDTKLCKMSHW